MLIRGKSPAKPVDLLQAGWKIADDAGDFRSMAMQRHYKTKRRQSRRFLCYLPGANRPALPAICL